MNYDKKQEKRLKIIKAAMKLFSKNGYYNTNIQQIADEAGIGKGTVYEYFKSKDALFKHCFLSYMNSLEAGLGKILTLEIEPIDKVLEIMKNIYKDYEKQKDFYVIFFEYMLTETLNKNNSGTQMIREIYNRIETLIHKILFDENNSLKLKNGVDQKSITFLVAGSLDALMLYDQMINLNINFDRFLKTFEIMLRSVFTNTNE